MERLFARRLCKDVFYGAVHNHYVAYISDWKLHLYDTKLCQDVAVADLMRAFYPRGKVSVLNILVQDDFVVVYFEQSDLEGDRFAFESYDFFVKRTYTIPNLAFCEDKDDRFYDRDDVPTDVLPKNPQSAWKTESWDLLFEEEEAEERGVPFHGALFMYGEPLPGLKVYHPWVDDEPRSKCYFQSAYSTATVRLEDYGNYTNEIYTFDTHSVLIYLESCQVVHVRLEDMFAQTYYDLLFPYLTRPFPDALIWIVATFLAHVQLNT